MTIRWFNDLGSQDVNEVGGVGGAVTPDQYMVFKRAGGSCPA